jgi:prolyl-tRNA synthetase
MIVVVGKALEQGNVELRVRKSGEKSEILVGSAVDEIAKTLASLK